MPHLDDLERIGGRAAGLFLPLDLPSRFRYFQIGCHCTQQRCIFCTVSPHCSSFWSFFPRSSVSRRRGKLGNQRADLTTWRSRFVRGGSVSIYFVWDGLRLEFWPVRSRANADEEITRIPICGMQNDKSTNRSRGCTRAARADPCVNPIASGTIDG